MRPLHKSKPLLVCTALGALSSAVVGFFPLFGGPGYESALAAGLILPSLAAVATAIEVSDHPPLPSWGFVRGIETGALLAAAGYLISLLHGARVGLCDARTGAAFWVLGTLPGAMLGGVWGAVVGEVAGRVISVWRSRVLAGLMAVAAPLVCVLVSLWRFYASPMVFAYDPFFGFFSGALYDTVVSDSLTTLLTYRAGTLATIVACGCAASLLVRSGKGGLELSRVRHPGVMWLAVASALASLVLIAEGDRLGHWQSAATIQAELGGRVTNDRCDIAYPRSLRDDDAQLLLRDCSTQAREVAAYFEIEPQPVKVFAFASPAQKRKLMGAADTSIAKPWRREVYVQLRSYPHPVIGHEIAHVLAGTFARGPFSVAGSVGGLWPDPGLIEGVAVAASPDDDRLSPQQWAAAMQKLGLLPPLNSVFALGFLGDNASKSYTVAGAFVNWVRDTYGMHAVRKWYGGMSLEAATGSPPSELERAWLADLEKITLSDPALVYAKSRFEKPGVMKRICPHAVDALVEQGEGLAAEGDCIGAAMTFGQASLLDPRDVPARIGIASCLPRLAGTDAARQQWQQIAEDAALPQPARDRAVEAVADIDLVTGRAQSAAALYDQLIKTGFNEDRLRTLAIKARAAREPREARAIGELLVGGPSRPPDPKLAYALLGQWMAEVPDDGLPAYLIGRNVAQDGLWHEAAGYLDEALRRRLPPGRIMTELLRQRIIVACAERDEETARALWSRWKADPELPESRRTAMERRLGSCVR
jgi:hypothetical protein